MNTFEDTFTIPEDAPSVLAKLRSLRLPYKSLTQIDMPGQLIYRVELNDASGQLDLISTGEGTTTATIRTGDVSLPGVSAANTNVLQLIEQTWPGVFDDQKKNAMTLQTKWKIIGNQQQFYNVARNWSIEEAEASGLGKRCLVWTGPVLTRTGKKKELTSVHLQTGDERSIRGEIKVTDIPTGAVLHIYATDENWPLLQESWELLFAELVRLDFSPQPVTSNEQNRLTSESEADQYRAELMPILEAMTNDDNNPVDANPANNDQTANDKQSKTAIREEPNEAAVPRQPGSTSTREEFHRYRYECGKIGIRVPHRQFANQFNVTEGTARNYYSKWLKDNDLKSDDEK